MIILLVEAEATGPSTAIYAFLCCCEPREGNDVSRPVAQA